MARTLLANAKGSLLTFLRLFSIGWTFGKNPFQGFPTFRHLFLLPSSFPLSLSTSPSTSAGRQLQTILTLGESGAFGGLGIATGRVAGVLASSVRVLYEPLQLDGTRTFTMAGKSATSTPPTRSPSPKSIPTQAHASHGYSLYSSCRHTPSPPSAWRGWNRGVQMVPGCSSPGPIRIKDGTKNPSQVRLHPPAARARFEPIFSGRGP